MFSKRYVIEAIFEDGFEELNSVIERHRSLHTARNRYYELEYARLYVNKESVWCHQLRDTRTGAILAPSV